MKALISGQAGLVVILGDEPRGHPLAGGETLSDPYQISRRLDGCTDVEAVSINSLNEGLSLAKHAREATEARTRQILAKAGYISDVGEERVEISTARPRKVVRWPSTPHARSIDLSEKPSKSTLPALISSVSLNYGVTESTVLARANVDQGTRSLLRQIEALTGPKKRFASGKVGKSRIHHARRVMKLRALLAVLEKRDPILYEQTLKSLGRKAKRRDILSASASKKQLS